MGHNNKRDYYTCPMHPEVKQDRPGTCSSCGGMELVKASSLNSKTDKDHHAGHDHHGHEHHHHHDHESMMASPEAAKDFIRRFLIVTLLLVPLFIFASPLAQTFGFDSWRLTPYINLAISTLIFYFGLVFFQHAKHEIQAKNYGMMTLVSLAVGAGYLFSVAATFIPALNAQFYLEISTLIWVLLFGHWLEARSSVAAGDALGEIAKLLPKTALKVTDLKKEVTTSVVIDELKVGDIVLVRAGEKVPADGQVIKGSASVDQSLVTGESMPVVKKKATEVMAGSLVVDGVI